MTEPEGGSGFVASARLREVLQAIEYDWTVAWISCQIAKRYRRHIADDDFLSSSWLHRMAYHACEREALMNVAKLTDIDKTSLSIHKLLNFAMSHPDAFSRVSLSATDTHGEETTVDAVREFIDQSRASLDAQSDALDRLRKLRDNVLAHSDKVRLSNPEQLAAYHVDISELEAVLRTIRAVLESCRKMYDNSTFVIDHLEDDIDREFENLLAAYGARRSQILTEMEEQRRAGPWAN